MLKRLGFTKFAYDYRAEHVPTFDAEMDALKKQGIELTAWWFPQTLNAEAKQILEVLHRHKLHTQLWVTGGGNPTTTEDYYLCIYNAGVKAAPGILLPPGGTCGTKACWKTKSTGFGYKDKDLTPDGALSATLKAGAAEKAQIKVTAKGVNVPTPDITTFTTGPIVVQLQRQDGAICFEADFSAPFKKNAGGTFTDKGD